MPTLTRGAQEAEQIAKAATSFSGRVEYVRLKDQEEAFLRMLTDREEWATLDVHMGVPTKEAPKGFKGSWPEKMSAVCQNDKTFRLRNPDGSLGDYEPGYGHCYIHENMGHVMGQFKKPVSQASPVIFALCVLREPVRDGDKLIGFRDKTEEWEDKDNKKHTVPAIRTISQKWSNFFGPMNATAVMTGTVCGSDYYIKRDGNDYNIVPLPEVPGHKPGTDSWKVYEESMKLRNISFEDLILNQASPEYYGRFFDPSVKQDDSKGNGKGSAGEGDAGGETSGEIADTSSDSVSPEELADLRARLEKSVAAPASG